MDEIVSGHADLAVVDGDASAGAPNDSEGNVEVAAAAVVGGDAVGVGVDVDGAVSGPAVVVEGGAREGVKDEARGGSDGPELAAVRRMVAGLVSEELARRAEENRAGMAARDAFFRDKVNADLLVHRPVVERLVEAHGISPSVAGEVVRGIVRSIGEPVDETERELRGAGVPAAAAGLLAKRLRARAVAPEIGEPGQRIGGDGGGDAVVARLVDGMFGPVRAGRA